MTTTTARPRKTEAELQAMKERELAKTKQESINYPCDYMFVAVYGKDFDIQDMRYRPGTGWECPDQYVDKTRTGEAAYLDIAAGVAEYMWDYYKLLHYESKDYEARRYSPDGDNVERIMNYLKLEVSQRTVLKDALDEPDID